MESAELEAVLADLRSVGSDTRRYEAKRARGGLPGRLWETFSAFSNSGGGVLLLGVDEAHDFDPVGVKDPAQLERSLASMLSDSLDPPVRARIDTVQLKGRPVVVVQVPGLPRSRLPCFYTGEGAHRGSYVRVADGDRRLTEYEVALLLAGRGQPREDERPVQDATAADLSVPEVDAYVQRMRNSRPRLFLEQSTQEVLRLTKVLVRDEQGGLRPSLAGLLALGTYPQSFLPQLGVTLVAYPTTTAGETGPRGERFMDNVTFDGSISDMAEDCLARLRSRMSRRSVIAGIGRRDVWEYPELALREAVVNALVHRDLSPEARGSQVQVEMYPDRLVVRNPGGLFGPVELERLGQPGISSARNALLLKLLEDVPLRSGGTVVENRGSGIPAMFHALRAAGMRRPVFHDEIAVFEVVFPNSALLDEAFVQWLADRHVTGLSDPQLLALARMRRGESLRNASYRAELGVDSRQATADLRDLVDRGLVDVEGVRGQATYRLRLPEPVAPAAQDHGVPTDEEALLAALAAGPRSRRELEQATGMARHTVLYRLNRLRDNGVVEQTGARRSPTARWVLSEPDR